MAHYIYLVDPKSNPNKVDTYCLSETFTDEVILMMLGSMKLLDLVFYSITTTGNCSLVVKN
jgi:hypothetical protein